jgi:hypothetical protein
MVAKRVADPYLLEHASWLKIRNRSYSQWAGREKLFERERKSPTFMFGRNALSRVSWRT